MRWEVIFGFAGNLVRLVTRQSAHGAESPQNLAKWCREMGSDCPSFTPTVFIWFLEIKPLTRVSRSYDCVNSLYITRICKLSHVDCNFWTCQFNCSKKGYISHPHSFTIFLCFLFNLCIKSKKKNSFSLNLYFYIELFKLCLWKWLKKIIDWLYIFI